MEPTLNEPQKIPAPSMSPFISTPNPWVGLIRLAGALVVVQPETGFMVLVGETKEPVDFATYGLAPPPTTRCGDGTHPVYPLRAQGPVRLARPKLFLRLDGSGFDPMAAAILVAEALLIRRNGSVSERLWNLVIDSSRPVVDAGGGEGAPSWVRQGDGGRDATWLRSVPGNIWNMVRDTVLRC